jgi:hypothetical protein
MPFNYRNKISIWLMVRWQAVSDRPYPTSAPAPGGVGGDNAVIGVSVIHVDVATLELAALEQLHDLVVGRPARAARAAVHHLEGPRTSPLRSATLHEAS